MPEGRGWWGRRAAPRRAARRRRRRTFIHACWMLASSMVRIWLM
jgi:hypothetical protein